jgi:crotonobetainyl-CoA:carnitine CoA-transferase CaiB-like acyl-CoA transferase
VAERLGLGDDDLAAAHPRLIRVYVTGFGTSGPSVDAPVFDAIVQAHLGSAESTPPAIAPTYVVDKVTATLTCQATLAALFDRERTGTADRIDVALLDAAAYLSFVDTMVNRTFLDHAPAEASNQQAAAIRAVETADGWLIAAPVTAVQIRRTCDILGRPELADELLAMGDATALTARLFAELDAVAKQHPTAHWVAAFQSIDVPAGPCLTIDEHLADPQVVHNHIYEEHDRGDLGRVREVRYPAVFSSYGELWPRCSSPALPT